MATHGYGAAGNYTQETYDQVNTANALQALAFEEMEDKEAMANLTSINLPLSQSLMQAQEKILEISKEIQALHTHEKAKIPTAEIPLLNNNTKETKSKCYCWNHGRTRRLDHTSAT